MQTFLPYRDFRRTARVLDDLRLGKQRVETLQILRALTREQYGWKNHPAVLMWQGHIPALVAYGVAITDEWLRRGRADSCMAQIVEFDEEPSSQQQLGAADRLPPWLGQRAFHRSHQSSLVRKDPEHYRRYFPNVPDDLPYVWPVRKSTSADAERPARPRR